MGLVIGITGGIGSGKSAVTDRLAALGIPIVDADLAARVVVEPGTPGLAAIVEHFGPQVLTPDGQLDRPALRALVFNDPSERRWLERLTHPLIGEEIRRQLGQALAEGQAPPYAVLSSPLLLESSQHEAVDHVVVVDVPESVQVARTMARDNNTEALVQKIMQAQLPRAERLARADSVIDNSGSLEELTAQVEALHQRLLVLAGEAGQAR